MKNVERINDDWQHVSFDEFVAIFRENGCDRDSWDVRKFASGTDFCVLDQLIGTVLPGNCWTDVKQMRAELRGIKAPTIDPRPRTARVLRANVVRWLASSAVKPCINVVRGNSGGGVMALGLLEHDHQKQVGRLLQGGAGVTQFGSRLLLAV